MLDWVRQAEKEKQRRKCQLYKEMLDNQILLNKQYRQQQLVKRKSLPVNNLNQMLNRAQLSKNKKIVYVKKMNTKDQYENDSILPSLVDESRFYKGKSRYRSIDQVETKNYATNVMRTEPDLHLSSQSQFEDIISQLQTINNNQNHTRKKRNRKLQSNLQYSNMNGHNLQKLSTWRLAQVANPQHKNYLKIAQKEKVRNSAQKYKEFLNPYLQKLEEIKAAINQSYFSSADGQKEDQSNIAESQATNNNKGRNNLELNIQREKFMQVLKKVNKRGKNLVQRISHFPSPKTQQLNKVNN